MNRVEYLSREKKTTSSIWLQFHRRYEIHKKNSNNIDLYCFYEGVDDSKYYNSKIKSCNNLNISHFECKGKSGVIKTREVFYQKDEIKKANLTFFIDVDFDKFIKPDILSEYLTYQDLYITPCYGIENFYTTLEVFKEVLKCEFNFNEENDNFILLSNYFENRQKEFHNIVSKLNSFIATYNYFYEKDKSIGKIDYQNLKFTDIIKYFTLKKIEVKESLLENLENKLNHKPNNFDEKMIEIGKEIIKNPQCYFRGKFEIEFLYEFIELINRDKNFKGNLHLTKKNIISNLSQYAIIDNNLINFIENNL